MLWLKVFVQFCLIVAFVKSTTNNRCPEGAFVSEETLSDCYIFEKEKMNWFDADDFCGKKFVGGRLAFVHEILEGSLFSAKALNISISEFWIGANNFNNSANWTYTDGSALQYTESWLTWDIKQPQNPETQRCAAIKSVEQRWKTSKCSDLKSFICQIGRIIPSNDWIPFNETGFQYKVFNFPTTHSVADFICQKENSRLISIHSKQEMIFATVIVKPYTLKKDFNSCLSIFQTWIGLYTPDNNKSWIWLDKSPYNDTIHRDFWAPLEPDNPGHQKCGNIYTENPCHPRMQLKFYNYACYVHMSNFICKKPI